MINLLKTDRPYLSLDLRKELELVPISVLLDTPSKFHIS